MLSCWNCSVFKSISSPPAYEDILGNQYQNDGVQGQQQQQQEQEQQEQQQQQEQRQYPWCCRLLSYSTSAASFLLLCLCSCWVYTAFRPMGMHDKIISGLDLHWRFTPPPENQMLKEASPPMAVWVFLVSVQVIDTVFYQK